MANYLTPSIMKNILGKELTPVQLDYVSKFNQYMPQYNINTLPRIQFFMAIVLGETGFREIEENFRYGEDMIRKMWGNRFDKNEDIGFYSVKGKPNYEAAASRLANKVYGHPKSSLGNNQKSPTNSETMSYTDSDGWVYRGSGFIQLTGRSNFGKYWSGNPDDVRKAEGAVITACRYAQIRKNTTGQKLTILDYADQYTAQSFIEACKCVGRCANQDNYKKKREKLKLCRQYITADATGLAAAKPFDNDKGVYVFGSENNTYNKFLADLFPPYSNVFLEALKITSK